MDDIEPEPSRKNTWPDDAGAKVAMEKFKKQRNVVPWWFKEVIYTRFCLRGFKDSFQKVHLLTGVTGGRNLFWIHSVI